MRAISGRHRGGPSFMSAEFFEFLFLKAKNLTIKHRLTVVAVNLCVTLTLSASNWFWKTRLMLTEAMMKFCAIAVAAIECVKFCDA
jgi:hypothetical protein